MSEDGRKEADDEAKGTPAPSDEAPCPDGGGAESEEDEGEAVIRPYEGKVGESGGNLRGREGWFRRRAGGK